MNSLNKIEHCLSSTQQRHKTEDLRSAGIVIIDRERERESLTCTIDLTVFVRTKVKIFTRDLREFSFINRRDISAH